MTSITMEHLIKLHTQGWRITGTAEHCGEGWTWMKPAPQGGYQLVGCICHHTPDE